MKSQGESPRPARISAAMAPSSTVENYLKAVHLGVSALAPGTRLLPMGQLASSLGVAPGHRHDHGQGAGRVGTGRIRALQRRLPDRGGVTAGGDGAAPPPPGRTVPGPGDGHALGRGARRRRAPRARRLGPADRAHRRDARPSRNRSARRPDSQPRRRPSASADLETLLDCPIGQRVVVARVTDQDAAFLRFVERHELEARRSRRGRVARRGRRRACGCAAATIAVVTIGTRAASKLLVEAPPRSSTRSTRRGSRPRRRRARRQ